MKLPYKSPNIRTVQLGTETAVLSTSLTGNNIPDWENGEEHEI